MFQSLDTFTYSNEDQMTYSSVFTCLDINLAMLLCFRSIFSFSSVALFFIFS